MPLGVRPKDLPYLFFRRDLLTLIADLPMPTSRKVAQWAYGPNAWDNYPKIASEEGYDLLSIHIPKCAGTSLARTFGFRQYPHITASVLRSVNQRGYDRCKSFVILRHPVARLVSMVNHFGHSPIASEKERRVYSELMEERGGLAGVLEGFVTDSTVRRKMMLGTRTGRGGFHTTQCNYIFENDMCIVDHLFSIEKMGLIEDWLSSETGGIVSMQKKNKSIKVNVSEEIPDETREKVEAYFYQDCLVYDHVMSHGGAVRKEQMPRLSALAKTIR
jgi:hypothetical protein